MVDAARACFQLKIARYLCDDCEKWLLSIIFSLLLETLKLEAALHQRFTFNFARAQGYHLSSRLLSVLVLNKLALIATRLM